MKREAVEASIRGLKQAGIDFISILPDSDWAEVQRAAMKDDAFQCVSVSNEAIGVGVCAGAWLGGKKPAMLIPTAGIMAAAFPLTTLNMQKNIPVLMLVPYRGSLGDGIWFMDLITLPRSRCLEIYRSPIASWTRSMKLCRPSRGHNFRRRLGCNLRLCC